MRYVLLTGFLFILINVHVNILGARVALFPNMVGCIMILIAVHYFKKKHNQFTKLVLPVVFLMIYSTVGDVVMALTANQITNEWVFIYNLIRIILEFCVVFTFATIIVHMENRYLIDLHGVQLKVWSFAVSVSALFCYFVWYYMRVLNPILITLGVVCVLIEMSEAFMSLNQYYKKILHGKSVKTYEWNQEPIRMHKN